MIDSLRSSVQEEGTTSHITTKLAMPKNPSDEAEGFQNDKDDLALMTGEYNTGSL